jgi:dienelactone hydrolase
MNELQASAADLQDTSIHPMPDPAVVPADFAAWRQARRDELIDQLGIPRQRVPLNAQRRGGFECDGLVIEKWVFTSEPGSDVPAVLYRPKHASEQKLPAMVMTFGHGGSKSQAEYGYTAQAFARLGMACLTLDPIGEEERHLEGRMGTRAHDLESVDSRARAAGRLIMGKLVFDTMRGVDFLLEREDIDPARIGVSGNSLGGAKAGWMAALEPRLAVAIVSGWAFGQVNETHGKCCTRIPNLLARQHLTWDQYLALAAPGCRQRILNGDADVIIDVAGDGSAWRDTERHVAAAAKVYAALGQPDGISTWYERGGGHRPYPARKANLQWLVSTLKPADWTAQQVAALPELNFGDWCRANAIEMERLYGTPLHLCGATMIDLNIPYLTPATLAVLEPQERGDPRYTLEGWLDQIERSGRAR